MKDTIELEIRKCLKSHVSTTVDFDALELSESLEEAGVNSIDFIKVIADIEMKFEISFSDDEVDLSQYNTLESFVQFVNSKVNK